MYARILVPLDGSATEEALPVVARIARASSGSIHLLRVVSSPIDLGEEDDFDPLLREQEIETGTTVASDYLRTVAASPVLDGIQVTTEIGPGLAPQYILAAARSGEFDLTVLISHGRTSFSSRDAEGRARASTYLTQVAERWQPPVSGNLYRL